MIEKITNSIIKVVASVFLLIFTFLPEIIMFFIYGLLNPVTALEKIVLFGIFWFGGGSLCIIFFVLGLCGLPLLIALFEEL